MGFVSIYSVWADIRSDWSWSYYHFYEMLWLFKLMFLFTSVRKISNFTGNRDNSNKTKVVAYTCRYFSGHLILKKINKCPLEYLQV